MEKEPMPVAQCLAQRNALYSTHQISICKNCFAERHGFDPKDERCCDWFTCICPTVLDQLQGTDICRASQCRACGIAYGHCADSEHFVGKECVLCLAESL